MTIRDLLTPVLDLQWYWLPVLAVGCTVGALAGSDLYRWLRRQVVHARMRRRLDAAIRSWDEQGRPTPPYIGT